MVVDTTRYRDFDETVGTGWGRRHRWICSFVWLVIADMLSDMPNDLLQVIS